MMAAPIEAKPITSAMICRCFELRRSWNASAALTPFSFLPGRDDSGRTLSRPMISAHDERAQEHQGRARQQQVDGAERGRGDGERVAGDAAERRAAADEPEQPLGLPRVVDDVGERPELADEQARRA